MRKVYLLRGLLVSGLLCFIGCNRSAPQQTASLENLNVLLIMVDTLGAKHTSVYNKALDITPNLKKFADRGVVFENAFSSAPWTKPSLATVFTSLYPSQHKANALYVPLDLRFSTLPEHMQERGFRTVGHVSHVMLSEKNGFAQGFQEFGLTKFSGGVHDAITGSQVTDFALDWFDRNGNFANPDVANPGSRFFMFLHYFDPHFAYQHHKEFDRTSKYSGKLKPGMNFRYLRENADKFNKEDIDYLVNLYHEEILYTDQQLGRLFDGLAQRGIDKNTLIIFFADHGEEFKDHGGMGHSHTLYNELLQVPFIISLPGVVKPGRVTQPVGTIDIWPTIEAFSKAPILNQSWHGSSLKETLLTGQEPVHRPVFAEVSWDASKGDISAHKVTVIDKDLKLIFDKRSQAEELYNLADDAEESKNLITEATTQHESLKQQIGTFIVDTQKPVMDFQAGKTGEDLQTAEEIEQLRSLGYL